MPTRDFRIQEKRFELGDFLIDTDSPGPAHVSIAAEPGAAGGKEPILLIGKMQQGAGAYHSTLKLPRIFGAGLFKKPDAGSQKKYFQKAARGPAAGPVPA